MLAVEHKILKLVSENGPLFTTTAGRSLANRYMADDAVHLMQKRKTTTDNVKL